MADVGKEVVKLRNSIRKKNARKKATSVAQMKRLAKKNRNINKKRKK